MSALGIEMTDREAITGWAALAPQKPEFPLTPEDVRMVRTAEMDRIANAIRDLERSAWDSLSAGDLVGHELCLGTAAILFEELKRMACRAFVNKFEQKG